MHYCILKLKKIIHSKVNRLNGGEPYRMNQKEISIMYDRSFTYVGKLKKKWKSEEKWKGPTDMREIKNTRIFPSIQCN